jgi:hypothetical protein
MPKPPPSDPSRRGRRGRPPRADRAERPELPPESERQGPAWKRRAEARARDDDKGKGAGWGGVARKGAGRLRDAEGPGNPASRASDAFRAAAGAASWEPEVWIDEGEVRDEARGAVARGRDDDGKPARPRRGRRGPGAVDDVEVADGTLRQAAGPARAARFEDRLRDAGRAFRRQRFDEARKLLRPLAESAPTAVAVRELLGLTYYRLGRWKQAVAELEAFRELATSTEQHPVLADCYRALGRHGKVAELWEELREVSPGAPLVAEGRIVYAGSLADQGRLREAITVLEAAKPPSKRPKDHHLRVAYALADLYERAGDLPRARQLFEVVAAADPELGDVQARLRALR